MSKNLNKADGRCGIRMAQKNFNRIKITLTQPHKTTLLQKL